MYELNEKDLLSKIHLYKLDRTDGWCHISVHEVIASESAKVEFIAVPNLVVQQAEKEYFGIGDSVETALNDCLAKIKSVEIKTLFPDLQEAYKQSNP